MSFGSPRLKRNVCCAMRVRTTKIRNYITISFATIKRVEDYTCTRERERCI